MIPVLLGLGSLIVTGAVLEEIDEQKQKSAPTVEKKIVSREYVRLLERKGELKLKRAGD